MCCEQAAKVASLLRRDTDCFKIESWPVIRIAERRIFWLEHILFKNGHWFGGVGLSNRPYPAPGAVAMSGF